MTASSQPTDKLQERLEQLVAIYGPHHGLMREAIFVHMEALARAVLSYRFCINANDGADHSHCPARIDAELSRSLGVNQ